MVDYSQVGGKDNGGYNSPYFGWLCYNYCIFWFVDVHINHDTFVFVIKFVNSQFALAMWAGLLKPMDIINKINHGCTCEKICLFITCSTKLFEEGYYICGKWRGNLSTFARTLTFIVICVLLTLEALSKVIVLGMHLATCVMISRFLLVFKWLIWILQVFI
jgi:hypothetical protein